MKRQSPRGGRIINNGSISAQRAAPALGAVHGDEARDHGPHEVDVARRPRVRHRLRADRHRQRRHRDDRADARPASSRPTARRARADDGRRPRRASGRLHGDAAARRERAVHDGDGDEDAVHRPRLSGSRPGIELSSRVTRAVRAAYMRRWLAVLSFSSSPLPSWPPAASEPPPPRRSRSPRERQRHRRHVQAERLPLGRANHDDDDQRRRASRSRRLTVAERLALTAAIAELKPARCLRSPAPARSPTTARSALPVHRQARAAFVHQRPPSGEGGAARRPADCEPAEPLAIEPQCPNRETRQA